MAALAKRRSKGICERRTAEGNPAGAGPDVTDPEPRPKRHRLWKAPDAYITPYILGGSHLAKMLVVRIRPGLSIGNMSSGEGFFRLTSNFFAEILPDCKEKWC